MCVPRQHKTQCHHRKREQPKPACFRWRGYPFPIRHFHQPSANIEPTDTLPQPSLVSCGDICPSSLLARAMHFTCAFVSRSICARPSEPAARCEVGTRKNNSGVKVKVVVAGYIAHAHDAFPLDLRVTRQQAIPVTLPRFLTLSPMAINCISLIPIYGHYTTRCCFFQLTSSRQDTLDGSLLWYLTCLSSMPCIIWQNEG